MNEIFRYFLSGAKKSNVIFRAPLHFNVLSISNSINTFHACYVPEIGFKPVLKKKGWGEKEKKYKEYNFKNLNNPILMQNIIH